MFLSSIDYLGNCFLPYKVAKAYATIICLKEIIWKL